MKKQPCSSHRAPRLAALGFSLVATLQPTFVSASWPTGSALAEDVYFSAVGVEVLTSDFMIEGVLSFGSSDFDSLTIAENVTLSNHAGRMIGQTTNDPFQFSIRSTFNINGLFYNLGRPYPKYRIVGMTVGNLNGIVNISQTGVLRNQGVWNGTDVNISVWNYGVFNNQGLIDHAVGPASVFINENTINNNDGGEIRIDAASPFDNQGIFNNNSGAVLNGWPSENSGTLNNYSGATMGAIYPGWTTNTGTVNNSGDATLFGRMLNNSGMFNNDASLSGMGSKFFNLSDGTLNNTGTIDFGSQVATHIINSGALINNGNIVHSPIDDRPAIVNRNGGIYSGDGSYSGNFQNSGTVAPGNLAPGNPIAIMSMDGDFIQDADTMIYPLEGLDGDGTIAIEIGGTQPGTGYDVLDITGNAELAGTLNVSLIDGFVPGIGATFDFFLAGSVVNTFDNTSLPGLDAGKGFNLVYGADKVSLMVTTTPSLGALDTAFNSAGSLPGTLLTPASVDDEQAHAIAMQADGKTLVAGASGNGVALVRYNSDGSLDSSFNTTGTVIDNILSANTIGMVIQADGKVVIAGSASNGTDSDFALARYNSDGSTDSDFGNSGHVLTDLGSTDDYATDIAIQADGRLVVSGYSDTTIEFAYALARFNTDGSLDNSFGSGGSVITSLGNINDWNVHLALQTDGKIIITSAYSATETDFFVARYSSDGLLDASFNPAGNLAAGVVTTDMGNILESSVDAVVQPDGKILVAGNSGSFAMVRYNADGSLDTDFANSGKFTNNADASTTVSALLLQPNGKILLGGKINNEFALMRFDADGKTVDGVASQSLGIGNSEVGAVALHPDGKIIAAGTAENTGTGTDFALARYNSADAPWNLIPDAFSFTDVNDVATDSLQTSNMITVAGLDADTHVPVSISGGEYAINGATNYSTAPGQVQNGDMLNIRITAASNFSQTSEAILTIGGLAPRNNRVQVNGSTASDTFSVTSTADTDGDGIGNNADTDDDGDGVIDSEDAFPLDSTQPASTSGGGGAIGIWQIIMLLPVFMRRRVSYS